MKSRALSTASALSFDGFGESVAEPCSDCPELLIHCYSRPSLKIERNRATLRNTDLCYQRTVCSLRVLFKFVWIRILQEIVITCPR